MLIAATADLHGLSTLKRAEIKTMLNIKDVDVVVVAGDILPSYERGPYLQLEDLITEFLPWCDSLSVPVVFTLGNHDYLKPDVIHTAIKAAGLQDQVTLLINEHVIIDGVSFYGNPWTPPFNCWNWNAEEDEIRKHLDNMWSGVDVFVTHGPPLGWCDRVASEYNRSEHLGSEAIRDAVLDFDPLWTVCGHIHTGDHEMQVLEDDQRIVNVSLRNEEYETVFHPFYFEVSNGSD